MTTGKYAADGTMRITVVSGSVHTGLFAADGSFNVVETPGGVRKGIYHPCGAYYVTFEPLESTRAYAPDGSLYISHNGPFKYILVTGDLDNLLLATNSALLLVNAASRLLLSH